MSEQIVKRAFPARIVKFDDTRQVAVGVVLEPCGPDEPDAQGDFYDAVEIEKAAYGYLERLAKGEAGGDFMHDESSQIGWPVESYLAPVDFVLGSGSDAQLVKADSWVMGMHYPDPVIWAAIKKGTYAAFSIGGRGTRTTEEAA